MNKERRSKTKRGILVAILLVCIIALIGGTYSRYSSSSTIQAKADVAKWAVQITADDETTDISNSTTTIPVTFKVADNANVVSDKIAPGVTAVGEIELDLTGTEVAVEVNAVPDTTDLEFASKDMIDTEVAIEGADTDGVVALVNDAAFTTENGKKKITVTLQWTNDDDNNEDDTTAGVAAGELIIPVTLTVQQHI